MKNKPKLCIYTAIYGGYDDLKEQPKQTLDCDFLCFTDNPLSQTNGWRIVYMSGKPTLHPRLQAKYYKLMSHKVLVPANGWWPFHRDTKLTKYDITIWIDGSIKLRSETFAEEMVSFLGEYGMAMLIHPDRSCIYDEVEECWDYPKYRNFPLREQIEYYRSQGYPEKNGLIAAGIIVRDMHKRKLDKINLEWWEENLRWTYQDQLSLPYVLWKNKYGYDPINLNLWNNHLFEIAYHHSEL